MATTNPFDLLGDDDNDDPSQLIAAQQKLLPPPKKTPAPAAANTKTAKLPSKPLPPAQAGKASYSGSFYWLFISISLALDRDI